MDNVTLIRVVSGVLAVVVAIILIYRMKKKAPRIGAFFGLRFDVSTLQRFDVFTGFPAEASASPLPVMPSSARLGPAGAWPRRPAVS